MKLLDILLKLFGGSGTKLADFLRRVAGAGLDVSDEAQELLDKLEGTVIDEALAAEIAKELQDIAQGKINPRIHPSDAG